MDLQTPLVNIFSSTPCLVGFWGSGIGAGSSALSSAGRAELQVRTRLGPFAELLAELDRLVDDQLAIVGPNDLDPFQWPRGRAFEIGPVLSESRAVARAFELVFRGQPARSATQVGADSEQRVKSAVLTDDPHPLLLHEAFGDLTCV